MTIVPVLAQYDQSAPTPASAFIGLAPMVFLLVGLYVVFRSPPEFGQPPHRTKHFWLLLPLFALASFSYQYTAHLHSPHFSTADLVVWLGAILLLPFIAAWFVVRGVQTARRRQTAPRQISVMQVVLIVIAALCFILASFFPKHP